MLHSLPNLSGTLYCVTLQPIQVHCKTWQPYRKTPPCSTSYHSAKEGSTLLQNNQEQSIASHHTPLQSIPQPWTSFRKIPLYSFAFHSQKNGSIHFQPIMVCLLRHIKRHSSSFYKIRLLSTTFHHVLLHSFLTNKVHSLPKQSETLYCVLLQRFPFHFIAFHLIAEDLTMFSCVPFHLREVRLLPHHPGTLYCVTLHAFNTRVQNCT